MSLSIANFKTLLLQEALKKIGFDPGEPDGLWGKNTEAAFIRSKKSKTWLIQTGVVARGFSVGKHGIDGAWGNDTEKAVNDAYAAYSKKSPAPASSKASKIAQKLADLARTQVGVTEVGNNGGQQVREYQKATWLEVGPWAWCAAFICWLFLKVQASGAGTDIKRPQTAGAWDFENWAKNAGPKVKLIKPLGKEPILAGDILVFTFSHIGISSKDNGTSATVQTVEGNTNAGGSREGDGVYLKSRQRSQIRSIIRISD